MVGGIAPRTLLTLYSGMVLLTVVGWISFRPFLKEVCDVGEESTLIVSLYFVIGEVLMPRDGSSMVVRRWLGSPVFFVMYTYSGQPSLLFPFALDVAVNQFFSVTCFAICLDFARQRA